MYQEDDEIGLVSNLVISGIDVDTVQIRELN